MNGLEVTVLLGAVVLSATAVAPRLRVPPPLLLVLTGLAIGFVPEVRHIGLPPEVMLLLFLPVMLFWESLTTSLRSIRRDFRGIVILSTLLVVATAFGVAGVATTLGVPWEAALVLGAALAPPDATAAAALGRTLPRRQFMLLKAESLTNDGTALVVYAIAVSAASGERHTALDVLGLVALSYLGGIAAGALVAVAAYLVMRRLQDPVAINVALLLAPFAAYLVAELVDASGVLAVVVAGLLIAYVSGRISTAASRRQTESAWPLGSYVLNGALFALIGIEAQAVAHDLHVSDVGRLAGLVVAVWVVLIVIRLLFPQLAVMVIRALDRRPSQRARRMTYRARVVNAVAGFRGAVSLAIALAVPETLDDGTPFPARDDIVVVTAGVIVLTLLLQGPLLPVVVRWADLPPDESAQEEERLAERELAAAALTTLPQAAAGADAEVLSQLTTEYERHLAATAPEGTSSPGADDAATITDRAEEAARVRIALLDQKREVLARLRRDGVVDDSVARRIQTRLDIEELRLTGVGDLD